MLCLLRKRNYLGLIISFQYDTPTNHNKEIDIKNIGSVAKDFLGVELLYESVCL